jgi:ABC-2 type transport system permease protein
VIGPGLRAELLKQRSTPTNAGLLGGMAGLVLFAVLLHGLALPVARIEETTMQLMVFGRGEALAVVFAGLLGAMSMTGDYRHGTIRPSFLVTPRRGRVVAAKVAAGTLAGAAFGLVAGVIAAVAGAVALGSRGVAIQLSADDFALLIAGGTVAAALWAAIGAGVGAAVRDQVPTLIGITAWLLFVEGVLAGDLLSGVDSVRRFAPGAAAAALTGQEPDALLGPLAGLVVLALYAAAAAAIGIVATARRDVA